MERPDPDILVRRFVDGDLSDDEVEAALHRIADDAEARELLRFELRMTQDLAATHSSAPPPDFAAQTMEALPAEDASDEPDRADASWLRALWRTATRPVALQVRPALATAAVLVVAVGTWLAWPAPPTSSVSSGAAAINSTQVVQTAASEQTETETVWIRFLYTNNDADSVAVAGDFNGWTPEPLTPRTVNGQTVWTGLVPVPSGEHEYQFVINGERWVPDPLAPVKRSDGFGAENAVLEV